MNKVQRSGVWLGLTLAGAYWGWKNQRLFVVHDVTTGESAAYPALRSRVYYAEMGRAMAAGEQAISRLPGWELISRDAENDILEASVKSALGTDDVTVYFFALGHGQLRMTIRSRTRSEWGDFGRNAAHILQLQGAMDDRLNTDAAF